MLAFKEFVNTARKLSHNIRENLNESINEVLNELAEGYSKRANQGALQRVPIPIEHDDDDNVFQRRGGSQRDYHSSVYTDPNSQHYQFRSVNRKIREFLYRRYSTHQEQQHKRQQQRGNRSQHSRFCGRNSFFYSTSSQNRFYSSYSRSCFCSSKIAERKSVTFIMRSILLQMDPFRYESCCRFGDRAPMGLYSHFSSHRRRLFSTFGGVRATAFSAIINPYQYHNLKLNLQLKQKVLWEESAQSVSHNVPGCVVEFCIDRTMPQITGALDDDTIKVLKKTFLSGPELMLQEMNILKEQLGSPPLQTYHNESGSLIFHMKFPDCDSEKMETILREQGITTAIVKSLDVELSDFAERELVETDHDLSSRTSTSESYESAASEWDIESTDGQELSEYCMINEDLGDGALDVSEAELSRRSSISSFSSTSSVPSTDGSLDLLDILSSAESGVSAFNHVTISSVLSDETFTNMADEGIIHLDYNDAVVYN